MLDEEAREPPTLATVLRKLRDAEPALRQEGVTALGVFGSVARGDAGPASDVDLALEIDSARRPTLFTLVRLQELIETQLGTKIDLGLRRDLRPHVAQAFEHDAVRAFLTRTIVERLTDIREAARDIIDIVSAMDDGAFHALPNADRIAYRALKNALSELDER